MQTSNSFQTLILLPVLAVFCLLVPACSSSSQQQAQNDPSESESEWISLFDGETLNGWKIVEGDGKFYVEDGAIVGEYTLEGGNSYLITEKNYGDFELELDVMIDTFMNSGVQIRSNIYEKETTTQYLSGTFQLSERTWPVGNVYGYQIEVDPTDRGWSGGFYEPGARGWLQTLKDNPEGRTAWKNFQWNHFRILAKGNQFNTWVNGITATDTTDNGSATGFIGFQLHTINNPKDEGKKVKFRDIRIREL